MKLTRQRIHRAGIWALTSVLPKKQRVNARHRLRARMDNRLVLNADWAVLSRAKSGRTWLRVLLSRLYQQRFGLPENELLEYDNFHRRNSAAPVVAMTHGHYLHELYRHPDIGQKLKVKPMVFLVRDPRDVAVSEFFQSTRRASGYKRELYHVDGAGSMFEFVMQSPLGLPAIIDYLNHWHREFQDWPRVHRLHYEALRADTETELARLCRFLGEDFSADEIAGAVEFASFEQLKKREKENYFNSNRLAPKDPDDPDSYKVRRGKVGGYRDYFRDDEIRKVDAFVAERLDAELMTKVE